VAAAVGGAGAQSGWEAGANVGVVKERKKEEEDDDNIPTPLSTKELEERAWHKTSQTCDDNISSRI
jgi:hypothetical protein